MREKLLLWETAYMITVSLLGTLLHFVYQWSGQKRLVSLFAPINESTWEHLKLLFFPSLLFTLLEYFAVGKEIENFLPAKVVGILAGMGIIVIVFYTYTGILGTNWLVADILTFLLVVVGSSYLFLQLIHYQFFSIQASLGTAILVAVLCACFFVFTFSPPHIGLFRDPITGCFGLKKSCCTRLAK